MRTDNARIIGQETFTDKTEVRLSVFTFIEGGYNLHRLHSSLDCQSPADYEAPHNKSRLERLRSST